MTVLNKIEEAPGIWVYKDSFDCTGFIDKLEKETQRSWPYIDWSRSKTGAKDSLMDTEYRSSVETSMQIFMQNDIVDDLKDLKEMYINNILLRIDECVWDYRSCYDLPLRSDTGFTLLRYSDGAEYHSHWDHHPTNERVISLVASLSEPHDGGELEFPFFKTKIKLEKNSLVIFPSNFPYTHIAHPVQNGIKYSLVSWFV